MISEYFERIAYDIQYIHTTNFEYLTHNKMVHTLLEIKGWNYVFTILRDDYVIDHTFNRIKVISFKRAYLYTQKIDIFKIKLISSFHFQKDKHKF